MISVEEAHKIVLDHCPPAKIETVKLEDAQGRILAEQVKADRDFPPFDRVTMDGIALAFKAFEKGQRSFKIDGVAAAGDALKTLLNHKSCMEVMTGAILPTNCDTVIRYEDLRIKDGTATLEVHHINYRQNVHFQGSDRAFGSLLMASGKQIGPAEMGVLATCGKALVEVYKTPKIAIVSSGDELVDVQLNPLAHQIRKSNSYSIAAALEKFKCEVASFHLMDDQAAIEKALHEILDEFDVVILSGGVSMGKFDFIPAALNNLKVKKLFHKVAQRPGKPFWFGISPSNKIVFALPGNPVSSFMCTNKYVSKWMEKHLSLDSQKIFAVLASDIHFTPNLNYFAQVKLKYSTDGLIMAFPILGNGSGDLANLTDAHAFMELPRGKDTYQKGGVYEILIY